jgi:hypothetical protein
MAFEDEAGRCCFTRRPQGLASRSDHEALAFLIRQLELLHSGSLGRLLAWGLDNPNVLGTLSARDCDPLVRSLVEAGLLLGPDVMPAKRCEAASRSSV